MIVVIDMYSGRPNPRFELSKDEITKVSSLLADNTVDSHPSILGFRGVIVDDKFVRRGSVLEEYLLKLAESKL